MIQPISYQVVTPLEEQCAITVQRAFRHWMVKPTLSWEECKPFREYISRIPADPLPDSFKKFTNRSIPVCSHSEDTIVFKCAGFEGAVERQKQSNRLRRILQNNGFHNVKVPEGRACGEYFIESKLPMVRRHKEQVGLYIREYKSFSPAVKEFLQLLFQSKFGDLLTSEGFYPEIFPLEPRYDNVCMYEKNIGIVDLEMWQYYPKATLHHKMNMCVQAITFYPLHFQEIMSVASEHGLSEEQLRIPLEEQRDKMLKGFYTLYYEHRRFVEILNMNDMKDVELSISEESMRKVNILMEVFLQQFHLGEYGGSGKGCLGDLVIKILSVVEPAIERWTSHMLERLRDLLAWRRSLEVISSQEQVLELRSLCLDLRSKKNENGDETNLWLEPLDSIWAGLDLDVNASGQRKGLACMQKEMIDLFFKELLRLQEIAYFARVTKNSVRIFV